MISQPKNRVQAIKSKFENLSSELAPSKQTSQLYKLKNECGSNKENSISPIELTNKGISVVSAGESSASSDDCSPEPNRSYLYKSDVKRTVSEPKPSLTRQTSDPGKKLHRSHAFRCDRTQKITNPKRAGSCNGRPEAPKMDRKLSKDRLKRLGDLLDEQMRKENFKLNREVVGEVKEVGLINSIADENVPPHILVQYAQVIKPKRKEDKNEAMTDSGVSSETENVDDEKGRVKKITNQFEKDNQLECNEKTESVAHNSNLDVMEELAGSSETMKLERKNPHLTLTDTLKKALKQPLPPGPPPKKPPRTFNIPTIPENEKKDTKRKLEKLEQVLMKRDTMVKKDSNIYDIAEENLSLKRPKEVHYHCTEILAITQRTLQPNQNDSPLKNCFNKLNCVATYNSMSSLPYTRLSSGFDSNRNSLKNCCSCSNDSLNTGIRKFVNDKCTKCQVNEDKHDRFKCHLDCKCRHLNSEFYIDEHIYDEPCLSDDNKPSERRSQYGTLNNEMSFERHPFGHGFKGPIMMTPLSWTS
ncbi:Uncharacterized protein OBRU01_04206 [Operophtera brumata]|uniref:Uncharacterized protein n=1 Tax=Operophtera brumata TaxID=104452 RepID=A0A0L7LNY4_OPEBR|nr:Uncharacterized protein OBRU01_04206 [Operophtera brumata]